MAFLLMASTAAFSQSNFYFGIDAAKVHDQLLVTNTNSNITPAYPHFVKPSTSLYVGYLLNTYISLETGFVNKPYSQGFSYQESPNSTRGYGTSLSDRWQIPLRLVSHLPLYKDKLSIQTAVGYHFGFNPYSSSSIYVVGNAENGFHVENLVNPNYSLLEIGFRLNFQINKAWSIYTTASIFKGLTTVDQKIITERQAGQVIGNNTIIDQGSYHSFGLGVSFSPFNGK